MRSGVIVQDGSECLSQKVFAEVDARFNRAEWDAKDFGDLLIGEPFQISQDDRDTVMRWQRIDRSTNKALPLLVFEQRRWVSGDGEGGNVGVFSCGDAIRLLS
jgi:hypothetical protein